MALASRKEGVEGLFKKQGIKYGRALKASPKKREQYSLHLESACGRGTFEVPEARKKIWPM